MHVDFLEFYYIIWLVVRLSTLSYTIKTENKIYTVKTCFSIFLKWLIFCMWNVTYPRYYNLPTKDLQLSFAYLIFLDRPMLSSSSDALKMLQWYTLKQKRSIHRCLYICKSCNNWNKWHWQYIYPKCRYRYSWL